tara:strand:+ start:738 stop:1193 length:456 start_codon:yes stop_codon:yes gene_type:complete
VKKLIFKVLINFLFLFITFSINGSEIKNIYEANKSSMQLNTNMAIGNYVYSISVSDLAKIQSINEEKNMLDATAKLLNFIKNKVSWPEKINSRLRNQLWYFYLNQKTIELKGVQIMEQGQIGDKYFVAVGIEKSNLNKYNVSYNMILEELK